MAVARMKLIKPGEEIPLPHNIEAEQALLGAIMINNEAFPRISAIIEPGDFYEPIHQGLFEVMSHLIGADRVATPITMKSYVGEMDLGSLSPLQYMAQLCAEATTVINAVDYAKTIKDSATRRALFIACDEMQARILANSPDDSAIPLLDGLTDRIAEIRPRQYEERGEFQSFEAAARQAVEMAASAYQQGGVIAGLSTGLENLDAQLGGLNKSDLVIIAGRPGMGKTSLAANIAYNVARALMAKRVAGEKTGIVAISSLEMSSSQLAQRIVAEHSRISGWRIRRGKVSEAEFGSFSDSARALSGLPIRIDQSGGLTIANLAMRVRALHKRFGVELLVIDYLQLLKGSASRREANRVQEVTEITTGLKELAKELDVPIVALSQLSRQIESRDDKRPMLADLRESGSIEQDADVVLFVYREAYYLRKREPKPGTEAHNEWTAAMEAAHGRAEVIIGKNRHGPEGTVHLGFDADLTQFNDDVPDDNRLPDRLGDREKRERPKKLTLAKESTVALGILKNLVITASIANEGHVDKAGKGTKLVSYLDWKAKCAEELLDPDANDAAKLALMKKIVADLQAPSSGHAALIGRGGSRDAPYVWHLDPKS